MVKEAKFKTKTMTTRRTPRKSVGSSEGKSHDSASKKTSVHKEKPEQPSAPPKEIFATVIDRRKTEQKPDIVEEQKVPKKRGRKPGQIYKKNSYDKYKKAYIFFRAQMLKKADLTKDDKSELIKDIKQEWLYLTNQRKDEWVQLMELKKQQISKLIERKRRRRNESSEVFKKPATPMMIPAQKKMRSERVTPIKDANAFRPKTKNMQVDESSENRSLSAIDLTAHIESELNEVLASRVVRDYMRSDCKENLQINLVAQVDELKKDEQAILFLLMCTLKTPEMQTLLQLKRLDKQKFEAYEQVYRKLLNQCSGHKV